MDKFKLSQYELLNVKAGTKPEDLLPGNLLPGVDSDGVDLDPLSEPKMVKDSSIT